MTHLFPSVLSIRSVPTVPSVQYSPVCPISPIPSVPAQQTQSVISNLLSSDLVYLYLTHLLHSILFTPHLSRSVSACPHLSHHSPSVFSFRIGFLPMPSVSSVPSLIPPVSAYLLSPNMSSSAGFVIGSHAVAKDTIRLIRSWITHCQNNADGISGIPIVFPQMLAPAGLSRFFANISY